MRRTFGVSSSSLFHTWSPDGRVRFANTKESELWNRYRRISIESGQRITTRGIAQQLKHFADKYGLNRDVVYPHSFRHRFAKNFLDRFNDLALLADLMGHESIETTRIYLRRTASEQQKIVDKVVNW